MARVEIDATGLTAAREAIPYLHMKQAVAMGQEYRFNVTLRPEPEGGFTVRVPALPEIVTYGENEDEALANAKEAIELSLEYRLARSEPVPESESPLVKHVIVDVPDPLPV